MVKVKIRIEAWSYVDPWARYHGKSIDEPLASNFWETQKDKIIGINPYGRPRFTHEQEVDLPPGDHYVEYSNSSISELPWHAEIYVNGELKASGTVYRGKSLRASFTVAPEEIPEVPTPAMPSWWPWLALGLGAVGVATVGAVVAYQEAQKRK